MGILHEWRNDVQHIHNENIFSLHVGLLSSLLPIYTQEALLLRKSQNERITSNMNLCYIFSLPSSSSLVYKCITY